MSKKKLPSEDQLKRCFKAAIQLIEIYEKLDRSIAQNRSSNPLMRAVAHKKQTQLLEMAGDKHESLEDVSHDFAIYSCLKDTHSDAVLCDGIAGLHWIDWLLKFSEKRLLEAENLDDRECSFDLLTPLDLRTPERIEAEIVAALMELPREAKPPENFSYNDIKQITGIQNNATVRKYAKSAGVKIPGRGERNFRFNADEMVEVMKTIYSSNGGKEAKKMAEGWLLERGIEIAKHKK